MRKEPAGNDTGNYIGILHPDSCLDFYVKAAGNVADDGRSGNADYNDLWYPVFHHLLCMDEKKKSCSYTWVKRRKAALLT